MRKNVRAMWLTLPALLLFGCSACSRVQQQGHQTEVSFDIHPKEEKAVISAHGAGGRDLYLVDLKTLRAERLTKSDTLDEREPRFPLMATRLCMSRSRPTRANAQQGAYSCSRWRT